MFRYRLYLEDGSEVGEAAYADNVNHGDELMLGPGKFVKVLDVVPVDEISPYTRRCYKSSRSVSALRPSLLAPGLQSLGIVSLREARVTLGRRA